MAKRSRTKLAILGFLTWKPMSGYDLKKAIDGSISNFWSESYGQVYPVLQALADDGLTTRASTTTEGGRPQHVYAITEGGRAALANWLAEPVQREPTRDELLLKLFFGGQTDIETSINHLEASEQRARAAIARYEEIARQITTKHGDKPDARFWLMTLRQGLAHSRAQLGWAAETLGELRDMKAGASSRSGMVEASAKAPPRPKKPLKQAPRKPRAPTKRA